MCDVMSVPTKYKNQATLHLIDENQRGLSSQTPELVYF